MIERALRPAQTNLELLRQLHEAGSPEVLLLRVRRDYEIATRLLGDRLRTNGKPFLCHLVGMASMLAIEGADEITVRAGLLHAAYSHGRFADGQVPGRHHVSESNRAWLRVRAGGDVEAIVHAYTMFRFTRGALDEALADTSPSGEMARLILMRVCNEVDDVLDFGAPLSGKSRYRDSQWLRDIRRLASARAMHASAALLAREIGETEHGAPAGLRHDPAIRHAYHPPGLKWVLGDRWRQARGRRFG